MVIQYLNRKKLHHNEKKSQAQHEDAVKSHNQNQGGTGGKGLRNLTSASDCKATEFSIPAAALVLFLSGEGCPEGSG